MNEILYGRHAIEEALIAGRRKVYGIYVAERAKLPANSPLQSAVSDGRIPLRFVPRAQLDRMVGQVNHQGILADVSEYRYYELDELLKAEAAPLKPPILLLLDCLQDPQNLGSLIRTAEAIGVAGLILPRNRSASVTPAVVNATSGAVEHLKVAQVTNLVRTMDQLKEVGFWIVGLEGEAGVQRYDQADLKVPLGLVVGSEGQGLGRLVKQTCDFLVGLPMLGRISSLNASIAGSVVLYEAWRQRQ